MTLAVVKDICCYNSDNNPTKHTENDKLIRCPCFRRCGLLFLLRVDFFQDVQTRLSILNVLLYIILEVTNGMNEWIGMYSLLYAETDS